MSFLPYVFQVPQFLIHVAAMAVAVARWNRHPIASLLVVVSAGISLLIRLSFLVLPSLIETLGDNRELVVGVTSLFGSVGHVLLLAAVFVERGAANAAPARG